MIGTVPTHGTLYITVLLLSFLIGWKVFKRSFTFSDWLESIQALIYLFLLVGKYSSAHLSFLIGWKVFKRSFTFSDWLESIQALINLF
jgi:hypothetical protein